MKPIGGFYWHIHHDVLVEWSDYISERRRYIRSDKPPEQVGLRLRLLRKVRGKLPDRVVTARKRLEKARKARDKVVNRNEQTASGV